MPKALISYGSYVFSTTGRAQFGRKDTYQSDAPGGLPHRRLVEYTVAHLFTEPTFADNAARYAALRTALATVEAVLLIKDENDTTLINQRVRVASSDLPEQWMQHMAEVKVTFTTWEDLAAGSNPFTATYTPTGGSLVMLANVTDFKISIRSERASTAVPNRRETNAAVTVSGKVRANPQDTPGARRTYLLAQQAIITGLDSKEGAFVYGDFAETVRVESAEAPIKDGTDELEYTVALSYRKFPSGDYVEAEYSVGQSDDLDGNQRTTTVRGKVRADDEAGAKTKAAAIRDALGTGRILKKYETDAQRLDGADGTAFTELAFSMEFREGLTDGVESWKMTVTDKDDLKTGQIQTTYAGTVTAVDAASALVKARAIGDGKYPIRLTGTETVESTSTQGGDEYFMQVTFSYEYLRKGAAQYAEVASSVDTETFGSSSTTISGFAVADTQANAETLARSFKLSGLLQRVNRESASKVQGGTTVQFVKVDFTYTFHRAQTAGTIQFTKKTSEDLENREITTSFSGTAWAATENDADTLITALLVGLTGRKGVDERTTSIDRTGADYFISRSFQLSIISALGAGSDDILSAEYSEENTYSVDHAVITPIPFGTPYVQTACGTTPGLRVVSGSITTIGADTGKTWARTLKPTGGHDDPPREKKGFVFYPMSGTVVKAYRFDFTYSMRFASLSMT